MAGEGEFMEVSDVEVLHAEHQMLLRTDHRPDFDDALEWVSGMSRCCCEIVLMTSRNGD